MKPSVMFNQISAFPARSASEAAPFHLTGEIDFAGIASAILLIVRWKIKSSRAATQQALFI